MVNAVGRLIYLVIGLRFWLFGAILLAAGAIVANTYFWPETTVRYRVDASFTYLGAPMQAAAVWEEHFYVRKSLDYAPLASDLAGDALVFSGAPGNLTFFLLLRGYSGGAVSGTKLPTYCDIDLRLTPKELIDKLRAFEGPCDIDVRVKLMLVAKGPATDTSDLQVVRFPTSDPVQQPSEFPDFSGRAEDLTISVTRTTEPVSSGIEGKYPWIQSLGGLETLECEGCGVIVHDPKRIYAEDFFK